MSATRLNGSHDIILGQAAILASALDARRIKAMLQHQATNGWRERQRGGSAFVLRWLRRFGGRGRGSSRSEEHTSELQSLMRISYAVFCLKKQQHTSQTPTI